MKRLAIVLFVSLSIISCRFGDGNINISYSEQSHYYKMKAKFSRHKTMAVEKYMDDMLGSSMSFHNTRIDGQLTLDDQLTFYIKKSPGYLYIKFDKEENSEEAFHRMKAMCEGIKEIVIR